MKKTALAFPFFIFFLIPSLISNLQFNNFNYSIPLTDTINNAESLWVDSVYNSLSTDERIAQLFMLRALSNRDEQYAQEMSTLIKKYNIGGLCFFQGGPLRQAELTNRWQNESKTPILISIDGEWGLSMRLDSTIVFPRQMTLGAIQNDQLIYKMGAEIARQCQRIGIHMNFAPVIDINSNPKNPVINTRSFGECKYNVSRKGIAYMKGMQDNKVIAVAKHFPGHGDTDTDSHYTLPVIKHSKERLDTLELFPFKQLIQKGLMAMMVAHLNIPAYFNEKDMASTLSNSIVTTLLKEKLAFNELIITDALEMKGVSDYFKPGIIEITALKAGNDILLLPPDFEKALSEIKKALLNGEITESLIEEKCKKILTYKYRLGLHSYTPIKTDSIYEDLNNEYTVTLKAELLKEAITLVKNNNCIPLQHNKNEKIGSLAIGDGKVKDFQNLLFEELKQSNFALNKDFSQADEDNIVKKLIGFDKIIISIHNTNSLPQKNFGISKQSIKLINRLKQNHKIILCFFANPYVLSFLDDADNIDALFISYQDDIVAAEATANIICGKAEAKGKLPVTGSALFPLNTGIITGAYKYLKYEEPSNMGIQDNYLLKIDSLAQLGINQGAYPGCQILFAKEGKVFYHRSFGYHTYDSTKAVRNTDLYDIASVTKIVSTALCLMKLYDEGKLNITEKLSTYLPYLNGTDKAEIKISDVLGHQARFKSWIPFYTQTLNGGKLNDTIYSHTYSANFPFKVADSIYINKNYYDTIINQIVASPLNKTSDYLYSDLGLYFLREIIEKQGYKTIAQYVYDNFYRPLELYRTVYNPRDYFSPDEIIPSEIDNYYRMQTVHGYVNDQGAAMTNGIAAHAGIFSNSWELAVILQMLLNEGKMGGTQYINPTTVNLFTKRHFTYNKNNRRALLFDKPLLSPDGSGPSCKDASQNSYGHSGFTGTYVWVDPDYQLIYVFLSNRTYPNPDNRKISTLNIRTNIHQTIYEALKNIK